MNLRTTTAVVSIGLLLLTQSAVHGQSSENDELAVQLSGDAGLDVTVAESVDITVEVSGGVEPYTVTITDINGVSGGFFEQRTVTLSSDDDLTVTFRFTAPSDAVGTAEFEVGVVDGSESVATAEVFVEITADRLADSQDNSTDNLAVASILSRLDIDGDGLPDNSPDTDGDGLPDNWELGGIAEDDTNDRVVFFPAPSAIIPGTPPTPIFTRRAVATNAFMWDSDGDGLSDYIEVFGLAFIDEDGNGLLDRDEWQDTNSDGLPSPGEYPLDNTREDDGAYVPNEFTMLHDFDGFIFTDPTNPDTDGDSSSDSEDLEPLINPRSFGNTSDFIIRFGAEDNPDIDLDGLGNGMDMGNDLVSSDGPGVLDYEGIDNPENVSDLLRLFRSDLLGEDVAPESVIEDLLGADWDGNGLWRTTDVRNWSIIIDPSDEATQPPSQFFRLDPNDEETNLFVQQTLEYLQNRFNSVDYRHYAGRGIGLGWQDVLRPPSTTEFIPDKRIWAILYAWRMPGFDIDGDGFVGVPNLSSTAPANTEPASTGNTAETQIAAVGLRSGSRGSYTALEATVSSSDTTARPFDDRITIIEDVEASDPKLDGIIEVEALTRFIEQIGCGGIGMVTLLAIGLGLGLLRRRTRRI